MRPSELKSIRERLKILRPTWPAPWASSTRARSTTWSPAGFKITGPAEAAIRQLPEARPLAEVPSYGPEDVLRIRMGLGLTQTEMAKELGLRFHSQVVHLESGRTRVNWSKAILLQELEARISKKKR